MLRGLAGRTLEGVYMNLDVKTVVAKLGKLEAKLKEKIESGILFNELKRYADGKAKILKQKVKSSNDVKRVIAVVEQRKKQFEKLAKEFPREVKAVKSFIQTQRSELERIGNNLLKQAKARKMGAAKAQAKKPRKAKKKK